MQYAAVGSGAVEWGAGWPSQGGTNRFPATKIMLPTLYSPLTPQRTLGGRKYIGRLELW